MRLIAIETATLRAELAAAEDGHVVADLAVGTDCRLTAALVPALAELMRSVGWSGPDIDLVAVDLGPGSFTGTRVGLTCAKTLAYACGAELAGVCSVDVVADAIPVPLAGARLAVAFDAARKEVFCGLFESTPDGWRRISLTIEPYRRWLAYGSEGYLLAGPALERYRDECPETAETVAPTLWFPSAASVARLAHRLAAKGNVVTDFWTIEPIYMRPSAAEEKAAARERSPRPSPPGSASADATSC